MFSRGVRNINCPFCDSTSFSFDPQDTLAAYINPLTFTLDNLEDIVDRCIVGYTVFSCADCGAKVKYTYKDIERKIRQSVTKNALQLLSQREIMENTIPTGKSRVHIYCGKCNGFDGKGGCPIVVYESCEIKRFPNGL